MNNETKDSIIKFQQPAVFDAYLKSINNLTESDIKNIKKLNSMKNYSAIVINGLFNEKKQKNSNNQKMINQCYFSSIKLYK